MSGILAITFCGITMKNYVEQNISKSSSVTIRKSAHMFANMAELMIFLFVGVFTVTGTDGEGHSIHQSVAGRRDQTWRPQLIHFSPPGGTGGLWS